MKDDGDLEEVEEMIIDVIDEERLNISKNLKISRFNFDDEKRINIYHEDVDIDVDNDIVERTYYLTYSP